MLPYRRSGCTLQIVCTVFIVVVTATYDQERQPVGPEMCKDHCGKCNDCTFCVFLIKRLACIATWSKYPLQTNGEEAVLPKISKERLGSTSQRKERCEQKQSMIVLTRTNGFRCIKLRTEEKAGLLVATNTGNRKKPLCAFNLLNGSITSYPHIKARYVIAIAYAATIQHVLMSTYMPKNIRAFSLHTNVTDIIRRNIYASSIAVDDAQQLVFLATRSPFACVNSMTPDGGYFKNITCQIDPRVLCVDTRRDLLYVSNKRAIYSFTYDGQGQQQITLSYKVFGMTLGDNGDMIYYNDITNIMELNLVSNGTKRKVTEKYIVVINILYNEGFLYISSRKSKYIYVWHESNYSSLREAYPTGRPEPVIALMP